MNDEIELVRGSGNVFRDSAIRMQIFDRPSASWLPRS